MNRIRYSDTGKYPPPGTTVTVVKTDGEVVKDAEFVDGVLHVPGGGYIRDGYIRVKQKQPPIVFAPLEDTPTHWEERAYRRNEVLDLVWETSEEG